MTKVKHTAVRFTNWTKEDFKKTWNSEEYEFKAGESFMLPAYLAAHFAKHLVNRELHNMKPKELQVNDSSRQGLIDKCYAGNVDMKIAAESETKLAVELMNSQKNNAETKREERRKLLKKQNYHDTLKYAKEKCGLTFEKNPKENELIEAILVYEQIRPEDIKAAPAEQPKDESRDNTDDTSAGTADPESFEGQVAG